MVSDGSWAPSRRPTFGRRSVLVDGLLDPGVLDNPALAGAVSAKALLEPGAVTMHAQPIVCLADGNVVAFELLARTTFPTELSPDQWLRLAEEEGINTEVELAFLQAACTRGAPPDGVRLFINLSARTVMDPRIDELVRQLPPHVIEITEHEPVANYHELRLRLQNWPTDTTMLAIDDVGSGYSSMSHVLQLRPHFIKVDRNLVRGVHRDRNQLAVLKGIVGYARQCGATSLAEGVETHDELTALRMIGVDLVQGFLVGRPGPHWPEPRRIQATAQRAGRATGSASLFVRAPEPDGVDSLAARVELLTDPREAADEITTYLYENFGVLPSVYVERGNALRFLSGRGQWQVLDGIESGVGLTGAAHATAQSVLVHDVAHDVRYREAVPGIVAELAMPLWVGGQVIGILNVDVPTRIEDRQIAAVESAAHILEGAFSRSGLPSSEESPFKVLGQRASRVAAASSVDRVGPGRRIGRRRHLGSRDVRPMARERRHDAVGRRLRATRRCLRLPPAPPRRGTGPTRLARRLELQHRTGVHPSVRSDRRTPRSGLRNRARRCCPGGRR